ncbi:MAG: hypothetical protein WBX25_17630 [Rhodomicrobium sp.]
MKSNSPLTFAKDEEILGKTLCQPAGQSTYELDKGGRNWVKDNKIILLRPQNIEECFRLLDSGSVSAVVAPDLTGKSVTAALGLTDKVKALPRPVAIGTLHLIVPKTHPHASTVLYYINTALSKLKESGDLMEIEFENGQPKMPSIIIGPNNAARMEQLSTEAEENPEIQRRYDDLVAKKKEQFLAREASRKLAG